MAHFKIDGNRLIRRFGPEKLYIEAWGRDSLRIRATCQAEMPEELWALLPCPEDSGCKITINGSEAEVVNGILKVKINEAGEMSFFSGEKPILREQWRSREKGLTKVSALEIPGREHVPNIGGDYHLFARFEASNEEKIFGMGGYQDGILCRQGCDMELAQRNSQSSVPFYVSNLGYGFLWNNPAVGRAVFAKNGIVWEARSSKAFDYWITAGDTPSRIHENYAAATGTVPMMPDWAMGFWQCKLRYLTQDELLEVARQYYKRKLPLSVIVSDFFHWPYQGDWRFDTEEWPDPEAMVKELGDMGVELMVSIWPMVDKLSENYSEMAELGYLTRTERGVPYGMDFCGDTIAYDATFPEAREYVWQKVKKNYYDKGIRVFWLDEAEPEYKKYDFDHYRYHLGSDLQVGNIYPQLYAKGFYDGMTKEGQDKVLNLLRCAWAGSQRYGALVWSGDIDATFLSLREQLACGLNMAMAGIPWWTTDIGGFHGGDQNDPEFRELIVRWFQFGVFCPVFRLHGDRKNGKPSQNPSKAHSGGPNEIWSYGEEAYEILKGLLFLRERLKPYIEEVMKAASEKGHAVIRPVFYDFPEDKKAWDVEDQFMFGPDILVCPVMYYGLRERQVYLPDGACWTDAYTGKKYEGGAAITAEAPLEHIPVYLKNDTKLPIVK